MMVGRIAVAVLLAGVACALHPLGGVPRLAPCPGPLAPTDTIPDGDFILRERVRIVGRDVDVGLELVAERRGDQLVVVAFNSFGAKLFSVVQRGSAADVESHLGSASAIPPDNLLRDLHAARFLPVDPDERMGERVVVARPDCGYTATFVRIARRTLP